MTWRTTNLFDALVFVYVGLPNNRCRTRSHSPILGHRHRTRQSCLYVLLARERSFYVLVLGGSGNMAVAGKMSEKFRYLRLRHFARMTFIVKQDEPPNPFGPDTKMFPANGVPDLIEQFPSCEERELSLRSGASPPSVKTILPESNCDRSENPVIKGGIFRSTSR